MVFGLGDFNGHVGNIRVLRVFTVHGGNGIGKRNAEGRILLGFCDGREYCVVEWFKEGKNITFQLDNSES